MLKVPLAFAVLVALPTALPVHAQQATPVIRQGTCPPGYSSHGNYCTPTAASQPAIPKVGPCPAGYGR